MPKYVCGECGEVFESKDARDEHSHDEGSSRLPSFTFDIPDFTLKQVAVLGGVFLMATLFMGTAFFYSSLTPSSHGGSSGGGGSEPSPPVGYTIQSQSDVPQVPASALPSSAVTDRQLSQDVQLYLLTRPAVLLQYSCTGCPGTVDGLSDIAQKYNSGQTWVYVAPYRDMDSRIALTGFRRGPRRMDTVNRSAIEGFICTTLRERPVPCAFRQE